jgi:pimeloyl-ACP methyl ester carboxylesterase
VNRSTVDLPWGPISYLEWGGEPGSSVVLLLHGGGVDNAGLSWGAVAPLLAQAGYRVIAPDHPGYGQSPAAPWPATQQGLVAYVGEFADALGLGRHAVGGLSLGGGMAIGHTLARPDDVSGAMLLGSYGLMPRLSDGPLSLPRQALTWALLRTGALPAMTRGLAGNRAALNWSMSTLVRDRDRRTPELLDEVWAAAQSGEGFAAFAQWQRDQVHWNRLTTDYRDRLPSVGAPVLIVHGGRDSAVPVARARAAAAAIPEAQLDIIAGAGHWVQRDQPAVVVAAMLGFLRRLSGAV